MDYFDVFSELLKEKGTKAEDDRFALLCLLSDKVGMRGERLAKAYVRLCEAGTISELVSGLNVEEAKKVLKGRIEGLRKDFSRYECVLALEPMLCFLYPSSYRRVDEKKAARKKVAPPVAKEAPAKRTILLSKAKPVEAKPKAKPKRPLPKNVRVTGGSWGERLKILYGDYSAMTFAWSGGRIKGHCNGDTYAIALPSFSGEGILRIPRCCNDSFVLSVIDGTDILLMDKGGGRARIRETKITYGYGMGKTELRVQGESLNVVAQAMSFDLSLDVEKFSCGVQRGNISAELRWHRGGYYYLVTEKGYISLKLPMPLPESMVFERFKDGFLHRTSNLYAFGVSGDPDFNLYATAKRGGEIYV